MNALAKNHRRSFVVLALLFVHLHSFGQLKAYFSATPVSGCAPIVVHFTDSSVGNPTEWHWDLGNGVTSVLQNPSATYFNPGTYTVKLWVKNATESDTIVKTQLITVFAPPSASFTASDTVGCFPLVVHFADQSSAGDGTIVSWNWDFGDGNVSTIANPTHTYLTAGNYNVTLNVTNSSGCTKTFTKTQYIKISNGVKADFTFSGSAMCSLPVTVTFTNNTTGPQPLTYSWNFGDGATDVSANPIHVYTAPGAYTVSLIAVSPQGCADTVKKQSVLNIANFSTQISVPALVCDNTPAAFSSSTGAPPTSVTWDFGDGTTSTSINPSHTYSTPGVYVVKVVNDFGGCLDSATKSITVLAKPHAGFTYTTATSCTVPVTAQFTSSATGGSVSWDFGDGTNSTASNPSHTYTAEGTYNVTQTVANPNGCTDVLSQSVVIATQKTGLDISGVPQKGCVPITITPLASVSSGQTIATYQWSFGDGTTSTSANPTHIYTAAGNYTLTLVITTTAGCVDSIVIPNAVRAGNKPVPNFIVQPKNVCAFKGVSFTDSSKGSPDQWLWQFGDGGTSNLQNPYYQYSDTGWFNVHLIVWNNTCADSIMIDSAVHVLPPIANFKVNFNCTSKYKRDFIDKSIGALTWFWDFGDGTNSTQQSPSHTYSAAGTYSVTLVVTNDSCSHSYSQVINIIDEKANYTADTALCKGKVELLTAVNINAANISSWYWNFGDGAIGRSPIQASEVYAQAGTYTTSLKIVDNNGCADSAYIPVNVYGPTAKYLSTVSVSCLTGNNIYFSDSSKTDGKHPIVQWIWNYGDGTVDSSAVAPFHHSYTSAGNYDISLTVVDNFGCTSKITKPGSINIIQPHADFTSDTLTCTGQNVTFNNLSTGSSLQYQWNLGDGTQSVTANPVHAYAGTGLYNIQLIVTDNNGCTDSVTKSNYVHIVYPKALFVASDTFATCPPLMVKFTNQSTDYVDMHWNFGDGTSSTLAEPSHFYTDPGTYYVVLYTTSAGGCIDTMVQKIVIRGPSGSFTYAPLVGCRPLGVNFTAITKNTSSLIWDFSDGTTLPTTSTTASHVYVNIGDYLPKLILVDTGGCTVPITGVDTISVKGVNAGFQMAGTQFCSSGQVQFTNTSAGNDPVTSYQWDFGDGTTSTQSNPSHTYPVGMYTVQMIATTQYGCKDTATLVDTIHVYANPVITITGDSAACSPATFNYQGVVVSGNAGTMSWTWDLGSGITSNQQNPAPQYYANALSQTITAIATDDHGCMDTATHNINLFPTPVTNAGPDAWICRGSFAQLAATGAETYQWQAAPSLSCTNCGSPLAAPTDSTMYVVTGSNSFGCSSNDSVTIRVHQPFTLQVDPGDTICVGSTIHLAAHGADSYSWFPTTGVANANIGSTTAIPTQSTTYYVIAKDSNNCFTDTGSVYIKVWPIPTVTANANQTLAVGQNIQLTTTSSNDVTSWQWKPAINLSCNTCPNPMANPKQQVTYDVQVKNDGGCTADAQVTIFVICNNGNVFIPNSFSPNGDGVNDKFYPRGGGINKIRTLRIYNRWGEMVFEGKDFDANDPAAGWDGTYKGQKLTSDVYVYTCEVVCQNNEILSLKGDVTILR